MRTSLAAAVVALWTLAISPACLAQAASAPSASIPSDFAAATLPSVSSSISHAGTAGEMLHVLVGHSLFFNTRSRLHKVIVADPAVLNSVTLSPTQIVVTAMTSGISSLILMDETGHTQSYVISSDVDVAGLRVAMSEAMGGDAVNVVGNGSRVTLSGKVGTPELADTAVKLANLYTKEVANAMTVVPEHLKQVRLKVRILEVDRSKALQMGVNLFNPGGNTSFLASTSTSQYSSTSTYNAGSLASGTLTTNNPLNFLVYSQRLNLGANIQDLESKQVLQILAEPEIMTISGLKATIHSGGEFPFPVVSGTGASTSVSISFREYGVKLEFTPTVNEDGTIRLKVAPEVSALDYTNAVTIDGYTIPAISERKAETEVELRNQQSFAISGLLDQRTTDIMDKTPGVASIPVLGALFKSKNASKSTTELVVVITPTLVDPLTESADPAEPDLPVRPLNTEKFDKGLGKVLNPAPAAPPIEQPRPFRQPAPYNSTPSTPSADAITSGNTDLPANSVPQVAAAPPTEPTQPISQAPPPSDNQLPATSPTFVPMAAPATNAVQNVPPTQIPTSTPTSSPSRPLAASNVAAASSVVAAQASPTHAAPVYGPYVPYRAYGAGNSMDASVSSVKAPVPVATNRASQGAVVDSSASPSRASTQPAVNTQPARKPIASVRMVQIMALSNAADAESMVLALKRHGYNVAINHEAQDKLLHLEMGPFASRDDAEAMRQRLLGDGYNPILK
jgi:pilus assembly protein CpaC